MYRVILLALLTLGLAGCASLSQEKCVAGDWYAIGEQDGERGYREDRYQAHNNACSEYGVGVNVAQYKQGREAGLALYCTPENAYQIGLRNDFYYDVCPAMKQAEFKKAYRKGRQLARARCIQAWHFQQLYYYSHHYGPHHRFAYWPYASRHSMLDCY